jgi:hypothetical protein
VILPFRVGMNELTFAGQGEMHYWHLIHGKIGQSVSLWGNDVLMNYHCNSKNIKQIFTCVYLRIGKCGDLLIQKENISDI